MKNYANKILSELVGGTNFFQYETHGFKNIYPKNPFFEIKKTIKQLSDSFESSFYSDVKSTGIKDFNIESITADNHNGCKKVIILKEYSGIKYVYKSKPIKTEPLIAQMLLEINKTINHDVFFCPKTLTAETAYFTEFINCEDNNDINDFLFSFGNLLVFTRLLGLSDLHHENVLIKNNRIFLLDFESIFNYSSFRLDILKNFNSCTSIFDEFTVLDSLLLEPKGEGFSIEEKIRHAFCLTDFSLSDISYKSILLSGVENSIELINSYKEELFRVIFKYLNSGLECRLILRPTVFYSSIINSSFKTLHKFDGIENLKESIFKILFSSNDYVPESILIAETNSLSIGDIPFFTLCHKELFIMGKIVHKFDSISVKKLILDELNNVNSYIKDFQDFFEVKQLYLNKEPILNPIRYSQIISSDKAGLDDTRVSYMGCDLYSGYAGFTLGFCHDTLIFRVLYENFIKSLTSAYNKNRLQFIPLGGAFEGITSLLYYFLIIHKIYKDVRVKQFIKNIIVPIVKEKIRKESIKKKKVELLNGVYGQVAVFDLYQSNFNCSDFNDFIIDNLKVEVENTNLGLAHGLAGRLLMELRLSNSYYSKERIRALQKEIISNFCMENSNWIDYRTNSYNSHYWCNGGLGISMVLKESNKHVPSAELEEVINIYESNSIKQSSSSHLCCGEGIQLINDTKHVFSSENYLYENRIGFYNIAFFTGRSGVNYYRHKTLRFPNILMLEF